MFSSTHILWIYVLTKKLPMFLDTMTSQPANRDLTTTKGDLTTTKGEVQKSRVKALHQPTNDPFTKPTFPYFSLNRGVLFVHPYFSDVEGEMKSRWEHPGKPRVSKHRHDCTPWVLFNKIGVLDLPGTDSSGLVNEGILVGIFQD